MLPWVSCKCLLGIPPWHVSFSQIVQPSHPLPQSRKWPWSKKSCTAPLVATTFFATFEPCETYTPYLYTHVYYFSDMMFIYRVYDMFIFSKRITTLSSYFVCFVYCCCFTRFHGRGSCMPFGAVADLDQTGIAGSIMSLLCSDISGFVAVVFECVLRLNLSLNRSLTHIKIIQDIDSRLLEFNGTSFWKRFRGIVPDSALLLRTGENEHRRLVATGAMKHSLTCDRNVTIWISFGSFKQYCSSR